MLPYENDETLAETLASLERVTGRRPTPTGDGGYMALCPCHEDRNPSLSVKMNGRLLLHCFAGCRFEDILATLNHPEPTHDLVREFVAAYSYRTEAGVEVRQKVRYHPKTFRIRHRDGAGQWVYKAGPGPAVLYRLPEVRQAIEAGSTVYVVEGEKDADRLALLKLCATTNIEGAAQAGQSAKWRATYTAQLAGAARVVLIPDQDAAGRAHMAAIAQALQGQVGEVRVVELPGLPDKGDVSDWLASGHTIHHLMDLVDAARPALPAPAAVPPDAVIDWGTVSPCTHLANARRIAHYFKDQLWYALGVGWMRWTGAYWRPDPTSDGSLTVGQVADLSRLIVTEAQAVIQASLTETDKDRRKELSERSAQLMTWAISSESERNIGSGLRLAKHALLIEFSALNPDPWLFNVQNGTLDLRTGELRPHDPADLITYIAPIRYDPAATCPVWERFLSEVFGGEADMVVFLQRAAGWSLTGVVKDRALFFLYGDTGKNGKTTLVETLLKILGCSGENSYGYGRKVTADTFMRSRVADDNLRKAAALAGPRFVCTSEVDEEHRLNEQLIKDITGGDTLEARKLYQETFTFKPRFKPWMYGNHKPIIRGTDDAIWSRVLLVPFEISFRGREDFDLAEKLDAELPGILNWMLRGCQDWYAGGLRPPAKVQAATQSYRTEMDVFGQFIAECCVLDPFARVRAAALWAAYRDWCAQNGIREQSQTRLGRYLTTHGLLPEHNGGVWRLGIGLLATPAVAG